MAQIIAGPATYSTWIAAGGTPLLAHVHVPPGATARGAVVLCPPIAKEHIDTYRGLALAGQLLAERGVLAVRFDYAGVGDSAGTQPSPDLASLWIDSIDRVITYTHSLGAGPPIVAGLRFGALLAAAATRNRARDVSGLVLWDPVISASRYLRGQQALYRVSTDSSPATSGLIHLVGADLDPTARDQLAELAIDVDDEVAIPILLAVPAEDASAKATVQLAQRLGRDPLLLDHQEDFVHPVGYVGKIPHDSVGPIVDWIDLQFGAKTSPVQTIAETRAVFDGVAETIERIGPDRLFAIRTDPAAQDPATVPGEQALIVLNGTSNEHRIGPARLWVEVARAAARAGHSSVRFDRRGTGESGPVRADEATEIYDAQTRNDAVNVMQEVGSQDRRVVTAGICSGAWTAAYAAAESSAARAVLVNNAVWTMRPRKFTRAKIEELTRRDFSERRSDARRVRLRAVIRRLLPYAVWLLLGRRGDAQVPEVMLAHLAKRGVRPHVILCPKDDEFFHRQRGAESLSRLARRGTRISPVTPNTGDHAGHSYEFRQLIHREVLATAESRR